MIILQKILIFPRQELRRQPVFSQVQLLHDLGLAAPDTTELCFALNSEGFSLPLDALDTEECAQALYKEVMA